MIPRFLREAGEETDERVIRQRQKQIDLGKATEGYQNYIEQVPKSQRKFGDPQTPPVNKKISKRSFDGLVRIWRKGLHNYDSVIAIPDQEIYQDFLECKICQTKTGLMCEESRIPFCSVECQKDFYFAQNQ